MSKNLLHDVDSVNAKSTNVSSQGIYKKNAADKGEAFFNEVVLKELPNVANFLGRWASAKELGFTGYDHPNTKSFKCNEVGFTSKKGKDEGFIKWSEHLQIDFNGWKPSSGMAVPVKRGRGRPKGSTKNAPVGEPIPAKEAKKHLQSFIQRQDEGVICYPYYDVDGNLLQIKTRTPQKEFYINCWDGQKWIAKEFKRNGKCPLFGLEQLKDIDENEYIFLCEGEKAAQAVQEAGEIALGVPGATRACDVDLGMLKGKNVIIWGDNDDAGWEMVEAVAAFFCEKELDYLPYMVQDFKLIDALEGAWEDRVPGSFFKNSKVPEGFDAADLEIEDRKKAIKFFIKEDKEFRIEHKTMLALVSKKKEDKLRANREANELIMNTEESQREAIERFIGCIVSCKNGRFRLPLEFGKASEMGRYQYNGDFMDEMSGGAVTEQFKTTGSIGGYTVGALYWKPESEHALEKKLKEGKEVTDEDFKSLSQCWREILAEVKDSKKIPDKNRIITVRKLGNTPSIQYSRTYKRETVYTQRFELFPVDTKNYKKYKKFEDTVFYKNIVYPCMGVNSDKWLKLTALLVGGALDGRDTTIWRRYPMTFITGKGSVGKSLLLAPWAALNNHEKGGSIQKMADDPKFMAYRLDSLWWDLLDANGGSKNKTLKEARAGGNSCAGISKNGFTGDLGESEKKCKDPEKLEMIRLQVLQSNEDPKSIEFYKAYINSEFLETGRISVMRAKGEGVENYQYRKALEAAKTDDEKRKIKLAGKKATTTSIMSKMIRDETLIDEFLGAAYRFYKENEDYVCNTAPYVEQDVLDLFMDISEEAMFKKFMLWLKGNSKEGAESFNDISNIISWSFSQRKRGADSIGSYDHINENSFDRVNAITQVRDGGKTGFKYKFKIPFYALRPLFLFWRKNLYFGKVSSAANSLGGESGTITREKMVSSFIDGIADMVGVAYDANLKFAGQRSTGCIFWGCDETGHVEGFDYPEVAQPSDEAEQQEEIKSPKVIQYNPNKDSAESYIDLINEPQEPPAEKVEGEEVKQGQEPEAGDNNIVIKARDGKFYKAHSSYLDEYRFYDAAYRRFSYQGRYPTFKKVTQESEPKEYYEFASERAEKAAFEKGLVRDTDIISAKEHGPLKRSITTQVKTESIENFKQAKLEV